MEVNESYVVANHLGILHGDDLAINLLTQLLQFLGNLVGTYRTVELTSNTNLSGNLESHTVQCLSLLLSLSLKSGQLVSLLLQVLGENLLSHRRGDNTLTLRNQVVTAVT